MILLHLLTTRAALALADSEANDWLTRPCRQAIPDDDACGCEPERFRRGCEVDVFQHANGVTRG